VEFKQYLENENASELDLFEQIYQEDPDWIGESLFDIARGAGNFIKGAAQSGAGMMSIGDEALARMMGDGTKGRMKRGWDGLSTGVGNMGKGVRQALVGSPQNQPQASRKPVQTPQPVPAPRDPQPRPSTPAQPQARTSGKQPLKIKVGKEEKIERDLENLIGQYRAANNKGDRARILAVIAMRHPKWYHTKLNQAKNRQIAKRFA
jgi:hypothetical protein